ncbi:hypothetical protein AABB24_027785 [Solanum stoloniferum]|uniref:chorismate synthase n=1 Tax=Solanum stoloniferum TaxID=62892 RepID=A0ABD2S410_9SOLN
MTIVKCPLLIGHLMLMQLMTSSMELDQYRGAVDLQQEKPSGESLLELLPKKFSNFIQELRSLLMFHKFTMLYFQRIWLITRLTLEQIESNIVRCPNPEYAEKMIAAIDYVRVRGDSVGGVVTCIVRNVPRGLGTPVFDKLEAELAKACMSLPATKGFEFGSGFAGTFMTGSEHNDEFFMDEHDQIRTKTNRSGGIQGGISNGEIINMRIAFKPTSTIARKQRTVSRDKHETELIARGRHDPCVVPRAVPMVEAMVALVLVDQLMTQYAQCMLFPVNPALQEPLQSSTTESAQVPL